MSDDTPEVGAKPSPPGEGKLRARLARQEREIADLRAALRATGVELPTLGPRPETLLWVFGSARTGSTWLSALLAEPDGHEEWREPNVGNLFGVHYYERMEGKYSLRRGRHWRRYWILGGHRDVWVSSIRSFVLDGARARFPKMDESGLLVIKEPHGSMGAPLLMEALPESRMVLLVRDPRDVAASALSARRRGSWLYERRHARLGGGETLGDVPPDRIVETRARAFVHVMDKAREAYEAHGRRKVLVRYEDLRADTLGTLRRIWQALEVRVDEADLARAVGAHAFENLPAGQTGPARFRRKASPGGWSEDLTPKQAGIVEQIAAAFLEEHYGGDGPRTRLGRARD